MLMFAETRLVPSEKLSCAYVVGTTPVHLTDAKERTKAPELESLAVDAGLDPERARELVRAGDVVTRPRTLCRMGRLITGKSLDDRVGLYVMLEALRIAERGDGELRAAATVQEEVGLRGSRVAATRAAPEIAIAIDTCPANDGPGGKPGQGTRLGEGAAIRVMDASAIADRTLLDHLERLAVDRGIPHQFHVAVRGGTDTQSLQLAGGGAIAGCVSIPSRYVHSSVEVCHPEDIEAAVRLVAAAIETAGELAR
jgi:endoglucanase